MTTPNPISRRSFLSTTAAGAGALVANPSFAAEDDFNVVLILADDLGYGDLGCYGCKDIRTPNLDRLAKSGVRFTDYYTSSPVCSPTRCALLTGRYQDRLPDFDWVVTISPDDKDKGLHPSETTIAKMLQKVGYSTALFGKWHLGYRPEYGPNAHGFDEFFGFLAGNIDFFRHLRADFKHDLYENDKEVFAEGYFTDLITDRATDFIERKKDNPFFMMVSYNAPHYPIQTPDDADLELTKENWVRHGDRAAYAKMVERMDEGIGKIVDTLKKNGLEKKTLVIFSSDNGGERLASNAPFSGKKGHLNEGGLRSPLIMSLPGLIPKGKTVTQPAITMDIASTIFDFIGLNPARTFDGMSLMRHIMSDVEDVQTTFFWEAKRRNERAVRWGKWKWLNVSGEDYLYNLNTDPAETENLKTRFIDIVHEMNSQHAYWRKAMATHRERFLQRIQNTASPAE